MIPYGRQDISQDDIDAVLEVLKSEYLTQGLTVPHFEEVVADYCGARRGIAVNSATSALHIACLALELGSGDWLWTAPNTFVASSNCALYCGAKVDFVDIDPRTYNMCPDRLADKLAEAEKTGTLPKIVVPVHFSGQPCDMQRIKALSEQYGFKIIEDASHAIGARYQDTLTGGCAHSDITVFSFHPVKIVTTGEGGMALTNDPELADRLERYRSHGITSKPSQMKPMPSDEIWNYQQVRLGFNYRMTDIAAALGISQMKRLDGFLARRREIARKYDEELKGLPITTPWQHPDTLSSYHLYPIRLQFDKISQTQAEVFAILHEAKIMANLHYIPVYLQPYYEALGFKRGHCPEAESYFRETISLPMYPLMSDAQQSRVVEVLTKAFS